MLLITFTGLKLFVPPSGLKADILKLILWGHIPGNMTFDLNLDSESYRGVGGPAVRRGCENETLAGQKQWLRFWTRFCWGAAAEGKYASMQRKKRSREELRVYLKMDGVLQAQQKRPLAGGGSEAITRAQ